MGYCTEFEFKIKTPMTRERAEQIVKRLNGIIEPIFDVFELYVNDKISISEERDVWSADAYDRMKWYDWNEHMTILAKEFPDVEFRLEGNGEDKGDWWIALFKGERKQIKYCSPPSDKWED